MFFSGTFGVRMVMDDCFQRGKLCVDVLCKLPQNDAAALTVGATLSITYRGLSRVFHLGHEIEKKREKKVKKEKWHAVINYSCEMMPPPAGIEGVTEKAARHRGAAATPNVNL